MGVLFLEDGILKRKWYPSVYLQTRPVFQIVAPDPIKNIVLTALHNSPTGGHLGYFKTLGKVRQRFYWVGYKGYVLRWCRQCDVSAQSKPGPCRKRAKLGHVPVRAPLERIAVDIMGPLPKTVNDNEYIMVVGDYFTKWTEAYALKDHTAQTLADVLIEHFICRFRGPNANLFWSRQRIWIKFNFRNMQTPESGQVPNNALQPEIGWFGWEV